MIDQAREWLERLHASNAPEADMALDLLGRLDEAYEAVTTGAYDERCQEVADLEAENVRLSDENDRLSDELEAIQQALGADGPEEAIAMARTLREAFE